MKTIESVRTEDTWKIAIVKMEDDGREYKVGKTQTFYADMVVGATCPDDQFSTETKPGLDKGDGTKWPDTVWITSWCGKSVRAQQTSGGGRPFGGGRPVKSAEENLSIVAQTACKAATELVNAHNLQFGKEGKLGIDEACAYTEKLTAAMAKAIAANKGLLG